MPRQPNKLISKIQNESRIQDSNHGCQTYEMGNKKTRFSFLLSQLQYPCYSLLSLNHWATQILKRDATRETPTQ